MNVQEIATNAVLRIRASAGSILPYRTGNLRDYGVNAGDFFASETESRASIIFDLKAVPYTYWLEYNTLVGRSNKENRHKGFIERLVQEVVIPFIEKEG